jgi:hypothetical protein
MRSLDSAFSVTNISALARAGWIFVWRLSDVV